MGEHRVRKHLSGLCCVVMASLLAEGAIAQSTALRLEAGMAQAEGVTAGEYSLTELAARDRRRKLCLGYGASQPDHVLNLRETQARLQVVVESDGGDTTLLIQGPEGIDCNDNYTRTHRDAGVTFDQPPEGEYRIWVGGFNLGDRLNYRLRVVAPAAQDTGRLP